MTEREKRRHSHDFTVWIRPETIAAWSPLTWQGQLTEHSFSHIHVCEAGDEHTHVVGGRRELSDIPAQSQWSGLARFPRRYWDQVARVLMGGNGDEQT